MLTAILTSYSHNGFADEVLAYLKRVKSANNNVGGVQAYTAVVDAYARKGEFSSALAVMEDAKMAGIWPDPVMWMTLLSPCRRFGDLGVARQAFTMLRNLDFSSEEMAAAAYVVMADVYRLCGDVNAANELHAERLSRGLTKERGAVTLTVKGNSHTFFVNEIPIELKEFGPKIESKLNEWSVRLASLGVCVESIQCRHSEKLALAYAVCIGEKHIVMRKNLRICSACHEASTNISSLEDITIQHWDRLRVHTMSSGHCSCGGFY
jgi:pentatricopeptide repeat protein